MPSPGVSKTQQETDKMKQSNYNVDGTRTRSTSNPATLQSFAAPSPAVRRTSMIDASKTGRSYEAEHMEALARSRSIDPNSRVIDYHVPDTDEGGLGVVLQKIRSTPVYSLDKKEQPQKHSWFSKFRRHSNVQEEHDSPALSQKKNEPLEAPPPQKKEHHVQYGSVHSAPLTPASFGVPCVPTVSPEIAAGTMSRAQTKQQPNAPTQSSASSEDTSQSSAGFLKNTLRKLKNPSSVPGLTSPTSSTNTSTTHNVTTSPKTTKYASSNRLASYDSHKDARKGSVVSSTSAISSSSTNSSNATKLSKHHSKSAIDEPPLLRVNFAADTFKKDPPQQIPARRPKKGNVKFNEDTGQLIRPNHVPFDSASPNAYAHATDIARKSAFNAAVLIANTVRSDSRRAAHVGTLARVTGHSSNAAKNDAKSYPDTGEDDQISKPLNSIAAATAQNIDGSINKRSEFPSSGPSGQDGNESDNDDNLKQRPLSLAELYTRCCHLREILPIQATLRQLQGKTAPLSSIQLMNPRPTMIEILSFADFLAVAPITALLLDNVDLADEMFLEIISALATAKSLSKLSLQNVNLTPKSWELLCRFLVHNKSLLKLDISLKFPDNKRVKIEYKKSEYFARENLDWSLFLRAIIARGGLEDLNVNSCCIPHDAFKSLVLNGVAIATKRLDIAWSNLEKQDLDVLSKWVSAPDSSCQGLDISGNTIVSKSPEFVRTLLTHKNLLYLSLDSCNFEDPVEFGKLIVEVSPVLDLYYLNLSSNPLLFPQISPTLFSAIPQMKMLVSLHLDYNNLKSEDILLLADAIPKCHKLGRVSLAGCNNMNDAAAEALAVSVKLSSSLSLLNIDAGVLPASIARRLAHYCMQNMEGLMDASFGDDNTEAKSEQKAVDDNYNFEGEDEIFDDSKELIKAMNYIVDKNQEAKSKIIKSEDKRRSSPQDSAAVEDVNAYQISADGLAQRATRLREKVQIKLNELRTSYKLREMPESIRDKLVRFWYLDKALREVIKRYNTSSGKQNGDNDGASQNGYTQNPSVVFSTPNSPNSRNVAQSLGTKSTVDEFDDSTPLPVVSHHICGGDGTLGMAREEAGRHFVGQQGFMLDDGHDVMKDDYGVCVLPRNPSLTSLQAKKQEREEGELHKVAWDKHRKGLGEQEGLEIQKESLDGSRVNVDEGLRDTDRPALTNKSDSFDGMLQDIKKMSPTEFEKYYEMLDADSKTGSTSRKD